MTSLKQSIPAGEKARAETTRMLRLYKLLSRNGGGTLTFSLSGERMILKADSRDFSFPAVLVLDQLRFGRLIRDRSTISLTQRGRRFIATLTDDKSTGDGKDKHTIRKAIPELDGHVVALNTAESPLMRLYSRGRSGAGTIVIGDDEFAAGERLRTDFERAQLQPRISANWEAGVGGRGRSQNTSADQSDFAMDCRVRINKAIDILGPELANIALDVCCYLKGLQEVERERQWPPRSAKLMLKTALGLLARHYGIGKSAEPRRANVLHWGEEDYRPAMAVK